MTVYKMEEWLDAIIYDIIDDKSIPEQQENRDTQKTDGGATKECCVKMQKDH